MHCDRQLTTCSSGPVLIAEPGKPLTENAVNLTSSGDTACNPSGRFSGNLIEPSLPQLKLHSLVLVFTGVRRY
jgi:hypothetical protein